MLRRIPPLPGPGHCRQEPGRARLSDLQPFWQRVRARAALEDARIHGLVAAGQSLPMIGKLLGLTQVATTAGYAHLAADPVKAAAASVAGSIAAAMSGNKPAEVVAIRAGVKNS